MNGRIEHYVFFEILSAERPAIRMTAFCLFWTQGKLRHGEPIPLGGIGH